MNRNTAKKMGTAIIILLLNTGCWNSPAVRKYDLVQAEAKKNSVTLPEKKPLLVHFYASWCSPCLPELRKILEFSQKNSEMTLLLVSVDEKSSDAKKVIPENFSENSYLFLLDAESKLAHALGTFQFPETYLLVPGGQSEGKWVGPQDWSGNFGKELLNNLGRF